MVFASLFFAFVPWGFASFLNGNSSGGSAISGGGGERLLAGWPLLLPSVGRPSPWWRHV